MNKAIIKFSVILMLFSFLTGCSAEGFMDLSGFMRVFEYGDKKLSAEDFSAEKDEKGNYTFYSFFENENTSVMLKLICQSENKIDEVRIYLPKSDENAKEREILTEDISLFTKVALSAIRAFTCYSEEDAESILKEMCLYDKNSYKNEGELTKEKDNFYFVYLSGRAGSEVIIYNTYLKTVEETLKPESRPMYGDTTNMRAETVTLE